MDVQKFNNLCKQKDFSSALELITEDERKLLIAIGNFQPVSSGRIAVILNPRPSFCSSRINQGTFNPEDMQKVHVVISSMITTGILEQAQPPRYELKFADKYQQLAAYCKDLCLDPSGVINREDYVKFVVDSMIENMIFHAMTLEAYGLISTDPQKYAMYTIENMVLQEDLFRDLIFPD